jgi:deoxycytidylate deaminase
LEDRKMADLTEVYAALRNAQATRSNLGRFSHDLQDKLIDYCECLHAALDALVEVVEEIQQDASPT